MDHHVQRSQSVNLSHTFGDNILVKQALAGDQRSFEVLMNKYEQLLHGYIGRSIKDMEREATGSLCIPFTSEPTTRVSLTKRVLLFKHLFCLSFYIVPFFL